MTRTTQCLPESIMTVLTCRAMQVCASGRCPPDQRRHHCHTGKDCHPYGQHVWHRILPVAILCAHHPHRWCAFCWPVAHKLVLPRCSYAALPPPSVAVHAEPGPIEKSSRLIITIIIVARGLSWTSIHSCCIWAGIYAGNSACLSACASAALVRQLL